MASSNDIIAAIRESQRAQGPATILAIGTATPSNCVYQPDFADYYFRITKSEHMVALKQKFKRMCDKSMIRKRYMHLTEEFLKQNPNMCEYMAPSLDARQDVAVVEVPKLGKEAAVKAIKDWGKPKSHITHLIFCTSSGIDMPGADYQLAKLLGLHPSVNRFMMYQQGCFAGGTVLRLARDLAENTKGARVLVVCSEMTTVVSFRGPNDTHLDSMVGQALFGDGAAAVVVGSDLDFLDCAPWWTGDTGSKEEKMRASRHVLREYGNMSSVCVLFILDEMRKKSVEDGAATTGEGLDWGVLLGFGSGLTVETVVLHSLPTTMPIPQSSPNFN